nr:nad-dependent protein deacylase [Quercus suber]
MTNEHGLRDFHAHLLHSTRILALVGAGLSAASGLATFRGAGGLWRTHDPVSLATPEAFARDPALVWQFYAHRRHLALHAAPNAAHHALAQLSRHRPSFLTLSQNVDGLSPRAAHPRAQLLLLHGSLFDIHCVDARCGYRAESFADPLTPALTFSPTSTTTTTSTAADANIPLAALPHCPRCTKNLLRPGVVWFGEPLPAAVLDAADAFLAAPAPVDLILVVGTAARVFPAAGYIAAARARGARVCVVNLDARDAPPDGYAAGDWFFQGDAAEVLPRLLEPVIGDGDGDGGGGDAS